MVSKDYAADKLLKAVVAAGVIKITASGTGPEAIRIEVYHNKGNEPLIEEVPRLHWFGDVVDEFERNAEAVGFKPVEILDISKDIATIIYEMTDLIMKARETFAEEEVKLRREQLIAAGIITEGPQGPHVEGQETESQLIENLDWTRPQPVRKCVFAKPGTVYTVFGQIVARGPVHDKIKGAMYRCSNCNLINYNPLSRPADVGDTEVPPRMQDVMCRHCARNNYSANSPEYRNARSWRLHDVDVVKAVEVELADTEKFDDVDTLKIVLLGKDAEDVRVGEYVTVRGRHQTMQLSRRSRRSYPICFAYSIVYKNQEAYQLTGQDVKRVKRFAELASKEKDPKTNTILGDRNIIRRLVGMTGYHVIGCEDAKEAVLYTESSVGPDVIGKGSDKTHRQRIHTGLVGGPGSSKTTVSMIPMLHDDRNNFETAQSSSMKTITAIVVKEGGDNSKAILRTGVVAHTKAAVLILNEFAEVTMDDQKYVQDAMEEGQFTVNKHGVHAVIRADVAVVWTGNPNQGADFAKQKGIDLDEIAIRKQMIDRTDLLVVMRPIKDPVKREEFNNRVLQMHKDLKNPARFKIIRGFDHYVKLHILYARTLNPVMTDEAQNMIARAEARIQEIKFKDGIANAGSNRALGTLERLSTVIAKLKLHPEITTEDAGDAIDFYNKISAEIHQSADKPQDIAEYSTQTIVYILQNESEGLSKTFKELCELASAKDQSIKWYLFQGTRNKLGDVGSNKRMRAVLERLESFNPKKIRRVKQHPAEFLWVGKEEADSPDPADQPSRVHEEEPKEEGESQEKGQEIKGENEHENGSPDPADPADQPSSGLQENKQTEKTGDNDKNGNHRTVQRKRGRSGRSGRSGETTITTTIDEREYKILKAMETAQAKYNSDKVNLKESGNLIDPKDVWANLSALLPDSEWKMDRVIEVIEDQIKKGNVLTRTDEPPGRYYFIWRDSSDNDEVAGGETEGEEMEE